MRWYDKIETPKTGKTFLEEGINRLPKTDPKVSNYFNALPFGYSRDFDSDGYPILVEISCVNVNGTPNEQGLKIEELEKDSEGNLYQYYKEINGEHIPNALKAKEELADAMAKDYKADQNELIARATVTTANNNIFNAHLEARINIAAAIQSAEARGILKTIWRMADNSEVEVTIEELKEANYLALVEFARIKQIQV